MLPAGVRILVCTEPQDMRIRPASRVVTPRGAMVIRAGHGTRDT
jgi:hypothetical protein